MAKKPARFPESFDRDVAHKQYTREIAWADPRVKQAFFEALPSGSTIYTYYQDYVVRDAAKRLGYTIKKNRKTRRLILIKPTFKEHKEDETFLFDPEMLELDDAKQTETSDIQ
jgi:hypothetical protein